MRKGKQLLIRRDGQNIALVEDLSSVFDIGKGLIGSQEPDITEGLFEGVLLRMPGYRKKCRGIINEGYVKFVFVKVRHARSRGFL